ncbi:MAG TPA: hypothetical protein VKX33_03250 [Cyclobacteriaceae bacterium]|nr:hypothetical protein [Cyclobacteriaceae bacterium]
MIRFTFILVAGLLACNVSNAQSPQELKGPKAKNYKPWKQQARTGTVAVKLQDIQQTGPAFKNKKAWETQTEKVSVSSDLRSGEQVTGPKAKNRKVWKRD